MTEIIQKKSPDIIITTKNKKEKTANIIILNLVGLIFLVFILTIIHELGHILFNVLFNAKITNIEINLIEQKIVVHSKVNKYNYVSIVFIIISGSASSILISVLLIILTKKKVRSINLFWLYSASWMYILGEQIFFV